MKKALITTVSAVALCGALAFAAPAHANVYLTGGNPETQPDDGSKNDLFKPLYGAAYAKVSGYRIGNDYDFFGSDPYYVPGGLYLSSKSNVTFEYLGSEAIVNNTLFVNGDPLKAGPGGLDIPGYGPGDTTVNPEFLKTITLNAGLIDFRLFGDGLVDAYGKNGGGKSDFCLDCSLFVVFLNGYTPTKDKSGWVVDVFFDDGIPDDNHDDFAFRMTVTAVPVPAALPIIAAALAGFGFAGYRSRRSNA